MLSRSIWPSLSLTERQLLRRQWLQSGQCIRCFHASLRRRAGEDGARQSQGNDQGTPYNQPQRGPTRHQRAAQISDEVRMLNRDVPALGPSKPPNDGADDAPVPPAAEASAEKGVMGENMPPEREGPLAQGVAKLPLSRREDDGTGADSQQIRGVRAPGHGIEDPLQGGTAVLDGIDPVAEQNVPGPETEAPNTGDVPLQPGVTIKPQPPAQSRVLPSPGPRFHPEHMTQQSLIQAGNNASTIASNNFSGVLADRFKVVAEPGQNPHGARDIQSLAYKLLAKQIVRFESHEEKEAVLEVVRELTGYEGKDTTSQQKAHGDKARERVTAAYFQPLPKSVRSAVVEKAVKGVYEQEAVLKGAQLHKQVVLNEVARKTALNGTYLGRDGERLLQKVRSLLPAAVPARAQQQAGKSAGTRKPQQKQQHARL